MKLNALLPAFLLCGMTEGYTITFYRGSRCRGARLSTRRPVGNICHNVLIVDNQATSAIVQRESGDGSNTAVRFYDRDPCHGNFVQSQGGCVNLALPETYELVFV